MLKDVLLEYGLRLQDIVAGFMGGVVNAFVFKRSDPWSIIGSMIVGMATANYLGPIAGTYVGASGPAASFIVGLAGMAICQGIVDAAKKWRPSVPKGGSDGQ